MTAELELSNAGKQDSTPSIEAGEEVHSREIFPMCTSNPGVPGELWLPTYLKVRFAMVQLARGGIILLRSGYLRKLYADTFGVSLSLLAFFIAIATTVLHPSGLGCICECEACRSICASAWDCQSGPINCAHDGVVGDPYWRWGCFLSGLSRWPFGFLHVKTAVLLVTFV